MEYDINFPLYTFAFNDALTGREYSQSRDGIDSCSHSWEAWAAEKRHVDNGGLENEEIKASRGGPAGRRNT
jgi:hypothetical protein